MSNILNPVIKEETKNENSEFSFENFFQSVKEKPQSKRVCLVVGTDGTGKTGIVLSEINKQLQENKNKYFAFIDVDDGLMPLMKFYPDIKDRLLIFKPLVTKENGMIDYQQTMLAIRKAIMYLIKEYKERNIIGLVIDGLSTLLLDAQYLMKEENYINVEKKQIDMSYWIKRNKIFLETLRVAKNLDIDTYFIAHDDFLKETREITINGEKVELGRIYKKTNEMMYQKIHCFREENSKPIWHAEILKSKGSELKEGKKYEFLRIENDKSKFDSTKIFEGL